MLSNPLHAEEWMAKSDRLAYEFSEELGQLYPEMGSDLGLTKFDKEATKWSIHIEDQTQELYTKWLARVTAELIGATDANYRVDLEILQNYLAVRIEEITIDQKTVSFFKASEDIYNALFSLVNPQTTIERKRAAGPRFKKYVLGQDGYKSATTEWMHIVRHELKQGDTSALLWPSRPKVEDYLANSAIYVRSIEEILIESHCACDETFAKFRKQIEEYDSFVRDVILPSSRTNPILPRVMYVQQLRKFGVDETPENLIMRAKADYAELLPKFLQLGREIGEARGLAKDQRTPFYISQALRADHVSGAEALLKFAKDTVEYVENIVREHELITLPTTPPVVRLSTPAENAVAPIVHVTGPPPLGRHAQKPEYVFPVGENGEALDEDSHYRAAAVSLAAHESRPGHELQFTRLMNEASRIRVAFGYSDTNVEGWAVYVEHLLLPYFDREAQYGALQSILFRMARGFLDPMVQTGEADAETVKNILVQQLGLAESFASGEYARYSWRWPGQATSYYYGLRTLLDAKAEVKASKRDQFSEKWFNDSVISAGPMPYSTLVRLLLNRAK